MRSRLTVQGCVSVTAVVLLTMLVCFVLGFAFQFGVLMARQRASTPNVQPSSPTSTVPTSVPSSPTLTVPSPVITPTPSATPQPTITPTPESTPTPSATPTPEVVVYTVRPGDTLSQIAARFGVTVAQILEVNPEITDPDRIQVGQKIVIPVSGSR